MEENLNVGTLRTRKERSESLKLVVAIPRNRVKVTVSKGLVLSQLVPDSLSPVDMLSELVPESLVRILSRNARVN